MRDDARPLTDVCRRRERLRAFLLSALAWLSRPFQSFFVRRRPSHIRRVLFIRPDHLGDLLFATPALERWRRYGPAEVETILSVGPWCAELASQVSSKEIVDVFPYPGFTRQPKASFWEPYRMLWHQARRLRAQPIDLAVILRFDHWWGGLVTYLAGIPLRVGYATQPLRAFLNVPVSYEGVAHEVERNLTLIDRALSLCGCSSSSNNKEFPALFYHVRSEERQQADAWLKHLGIDPAARVIILQVGAGAPVKTWPAERFAALADMLVVHTGAAILLTGGPGDLSQAWKVSAYMKEDAYVLAGRTPLAVLAALMERSALVIGSDSGPLHLAVAVGAPSIHLYGPVDPALFGPWSDQPARHRVIRADCACAPCNRLEYTLSELPAHRCMETITVEQVWNVAKEMLENDSQ